MGVRLAILAILLILFSMPAGVVIGFFLARGVMLGGIEQEALQDVSRVTDLLIGSDAYLLMSLYFLLITFICMWLVARFIDRRPFAGFGFHLDRMWVMDLGFGFALGAFLMTLVFVLEWMVGWLQVANIFQPARAHSFFIPGLLKPFLLFLAVGIYEEMLVRGYLLKNLAEGLNAPRIGPKGALILAWLVSSLLFSLGHASNPHVTWISLINLVLAGLFLGLGYLLTGELGLSIGLHISWNFFQGSIFGFPVSGLAPQATAIEIIQNGPELWTGGSFGPEAGLFGVAAMLMGTLCILFWVGWRKGKLILNSSLSEYPFR